jgi:hypothetical protein
MLLCFFSISLEFVSGHCPEALTQIRPLTLATHVGAHPGDLYFPLRL